MADHVCHGLPLEIPGQGSISRSKPSSQGEVDLYWDHQRKVGEAGKSVETFFVPDPPLINEAWHWM